MNRLESSGEAGNPFIPGWKYLYPMYRPPTPPHVRTAPGYDVRAQLPPELPRDPRHWSRQEVQTWLQWCHEEFDIPSIDEGQFAMNGKALCLLLRADFTERAPRAGDILYNVIQIFLKEAADVATHRYPGPLRVFGYNGSAIPNPDLTHSDSLGSTWPIISSDFHNLGHVLHQPRLQVSPSTSGVESTVTLSPAPSTDSHAADSPRQRSSPTSAHPSPQNTLDVQKERRQSPMQNGHHSEFEDSGTDSPIHPMVVDTELKPTSKDPVLSDHMLPHGEPITNGRLLWDFLHQLLNDPGQRYVSCIRWKEHDTGIFKITDPNGLARLWGLQKNHLNMNFDKMSRALRYYYRVNILRKVQGERHCYQFLRQPTELKACKQRALLNKFRSNDKPLDMSINSNLDLVLAAVKSETHQLDP